MEMVIVFFAGLLLGALASWAVPRMRRGSREDIVWREKYHAVNEERAKSDGEREKLTQALRDEQGLRVAAETKLSASEQQLGEQKKFIGDAEKRLVDTFRSLSGDSLEKNNQAFIKQAEGSLTAHTTPLKEALRRSEEQIKMLEAKRNNDYGSLSATLKQIAEQNTEVRKSTDRLTNALKRPEGRGSWGEVTVENILKSSGASELCDFEKQVTTNDNSGRVDFLIHHRLSGQKLIIDSKVNLTPFLDGASGEEVLHAETIEKHAKAVKETMKNLSKKEYWKKINDSLDYVVMLVPSEAYLYSALTVNPSLLQEGLDNRVVIASPMTLVVLMRLLVVGWQKIELEQNAQKILEYTKELYSRFGPFINAISDTGKHLDKAVESYNQSIGSYERNVSTTLVKIRQLNTAVESPKELSQITHSTRSVTKKLPSYDEDAP